MAMKAVVADLNSVPEQMRGLYKPGEGEHAGKHVLDLEDNPWKKKADEFRDNNREMHKAKTDLEEKLKKYDGIDPEKWAAAKEALDAIEKSEDMKLLKDGKIDELFNRRTGAMKTDYEKQIESLKKSNAKDAEKVKRLHERLTGLVLEREIREGSKDLGTIRPGAFYDVVARARNTWQVDEEGNLVPIDAKGQKVFGKNSEPLTMPEYIKDLIQAAPFLFESGQGSGAGGSSSSAGGQKTANGRVRLSRNADPLTKGKFAKEIAQGLVDWTD